MILSAFPHALSHVTVMLGLGAGAVLLTVEASGACFTVLVCFLLLGQVL